MSVLSQISHPHTHRKEFFTGNKTIRPKMFLSMQCLTENNSAEVKINPLQPLQAVDCRI